MVSLQKWIGEIEQEKEIDWDFPDARREKTNYLSHGVHSYTSKYIPQLPNNLIKKYSKKGDLILDNFLGSGTTLIEASLLGRNSIGVDINKYPCLIAEVKTTRITPEDEKLLKKHISIIQEYIMSYRNQKTHRTYNYKVLKFDRNLTDLKFVSRLYSHENLTELLIIKSVTESINDEKIKKILLLCLIGILRRVSYLSSNFANDYVPRIINKKSDVLKEFLFELEDSLSKLKKYASKLKEDTVIKILNEDTRHLSIKEESIDLIVTHPPYISAVPYAEYFKLEMIWLGLNPRELNANIIGGKRSSNHVVERFNDGMIVTFNEMYRVLKKGSYACVVIGNARVKGKIIKSNEDFIEMAKKANFSFIKDIERIKQDCSNAWMKTEHILIFRKE